ncbi:hypothetical protein MTR_4g124240 [Medicago truncatula]|uniref:RNase H type-1 domain-containing protein n=1 Tax=Medicago truncatula TaxID=3880 RepID=G7JR34_MEDTR|nr:hypothetical protein MTR_4g124240 [Medicago truncatula]
MLWHHLGFTNPEFFSSIDAYEWYIRWKDNNFSGAILNVDGSCLGSPIKTGFGGVLRADAGIFLLCFFSCIPGSYDILLGEIFVIYHGLIMAKDLGYVDLV